MRHFPRFHLKMEWGQLPPFETGLLLSILLHLLLWQGFSFSKQRHEDHLDTIEIDLTRPFRLAPSPQQEKRAKNPGVGAPMVQAPSLAPVIPTSEETKPPEKPLDWTLPGPDTKEIIEPKVEEPVVSQSPGGLGLGDGDGEVDWIYLTELPRMLNRDELIRNMRRFYPESERQAGREGLVVVDIHIGRDGSVRWAEVAQSDGEAFDKAAIKVVERARFSPAKVGADAVAVKIRQTIGFQLE